MAWGRQLTRALEQAGATFTKLGQWAGTRPDLFPLRLIEPLRRLHEAVEREPWEVTRRAIAEAFGKPDEVSVYSRPSLFAGTHTAAMMRNGHPFCKMLSMCPRRRYLTLLMMSR